MSTLIAQYSGDGSCVGRCDSHCHDAGKPECDCICVGKFHGKGFQQAQAELTEQWRPWIEAQGFTIPSQQGELALVD